MTATTTGLTCSLRKGQVSGAEPPHDCQRKRSYQRPHLEALADKLEDTIYFVVRRGDFAVCYARAEGAFPIKTLTLRVGAAPVGASADATPSILAATRPATSTSVVAIGILIAPLLPTRKRCFAPE